MGKTSKNVAFADMSLVSTSEDATCYVESIQSIKKHARKTVCGVPRFVCLIFNMKIFLTKFLTMLLQAEAREEAQHASGGKGGLGRRNDDDDDDEVAMNCKCTCPRCSLFYQCLSFRSLQDPGPHVNGTHVRLVATMLDDQHRYRLESGLAISCGEVMPDAVVSKMIVGCWDGSLTVLSLDTIASSSHIAEDFSIGGYNQGEDNDDAAVVANVLADAHSDAVSCMRLHAPQSFIVTGSCDSTVKLWHYSCVGSKVKLSVCVVSMALNPWP